MNIKSIIEWLLEIEEPERETRFLAELGLLANNDLCINTNSERPERYLLNTKRFLHLTENQILDILVSLDTRNLVAYESRSKGNKRNRLTLLI